MEHHTRPCVSRVDLRGDETELFRRYHRKLERSVARVVNTTGPIIEDACSFAWLQLIRTGPARGDTLFAWLRAVACREAIRLDQRFRGSVLMGDDTLDHVVDAGLEPDLAIEARDALSAVHDLPPRQRQLVALQAAGFSYEEAAVITGDSIRTVQRQLMRAKRALRAAGGA